MQDRLTPAEIGRLAIVIFAVIVGAASAFAAQHTCAPYDKAVALLTNKYREAPIWEGMMSNGNLLTIYVSQTGSWTALETEPKGKACIRSAGEMWTRVNFPPESEM